MPTYITLARWTEQGVKNVKQLPQRFAATEALASQLGGRVKDFYVVMGRYDVIAIGEAPNDEAATKLALGLAMQGNVRTETLRAYTREEFEKIVAGLP